MGGRHDSVAVRTRVRGATVLAAVVVSLIACAKDDDGDDGADKDRAELESSGAETEESTTTTPAVDEPPATEMAAVQPIVIDLLADYDRLVEQFVTDPSLAQDEDGEVAQEFLDLFEPGSDFAEKSLEAWATWAETGIALEPVEDGTAINVTSLSGLITPVSEDDVKFVKCTAQNYVKFDDGEEVETVEDLVLAGEGTAVRVDGRWHLGVLTTPEGMQGCGSGR